MSKKLTLETFVEKAKNVHGNLYDYSNTIYKNSLTKIKLRCILHDKEFEMLPYNHLSGKGCVLCGYEKTRKINAKTKEQFIIDSKKKYSDRYDYSLVEYKNAKTKVKIICSTHGVFEQTPDNHANGGSIGGCKKCHYDKLAKSQLHTTEQFIEKANKLHNFKYNYSKSIYKGDRIKLSIICPLHGEFLQTPGDHYRSQGCNICGNLKTSVYQRQNPSGWSFKTWIKKASTSKNFDSFKVYIIRCWNENEEFYKIGRTYTTINFRFRYKTQLPYKYEILKEIVGDAKEIVNFELKLKKEHKTFKYTPKLKFDGMHECFYKINEINGINI